MLTVRIEWPSNFGPNYSVYSCHKYVVCGLLDKTIQLILDDKENTTEILLGKGSKVFVMNANGATIDKIYNN